MDKAFDELVEYLLQDWHVPGLSVAVLDGSNTHTKVSISTHYAQIY